MSAKFFQIRPDFWTTGKLLAVADQGRHDIRVPEGISNHCEGPSNLTEYCNRGTPGRTVFDLIFLLARSPYFNTHPFAIGAVVHMT